MPSLEEAWARYVEASYAQLYTSAALSEIPDIDDLEAAFKEHSLTPQQRTDMTGPSTPQGFLGVNLDDLTKLLPPQVSDAIKGTVGRILNPNDPSIDIGDPQPEDRPIPVDAGSKELSAAARAIDAATSAMDMALKFKWLIPDQYEGVIAGVSAALKTIRSWLD